MSKILLEYDIETDSIETTNMREFMRGDKSFVKGVAMIYRNGVETDINQIKDEIYPMLERGKRYKLVLKEAS